MELPIVVARRSWLEISMWKTGEDRKKEREHTRKKRDGIRTAELNRRDQVTAIVPGPVPSKGGTEVDNQVAAPTELRTPTMHRAKIAQPRVRMEGWRQRRPGSNGRNPQEGKEKKEKNTLDSYRPSHGRHNPNKASPHPISYLPKLLSATEEGSANDSKNRFANGVFSVDFDSPGSSPLLVARGRCNRAKRGGPHGTHRR